MLHEKLKENTRKLHDALEEQMFVAAIMNKTLTLNQYKQILKVNYLIHKNYESVLFGVFNEDLTRKLNLVHRMKLPALELDLAEARLEPLTLERTCIFPEKEGYTEAFALGAMYVLEGATLGGSVIQKQLANNQNFNEQFNFHYYRVYGIDLIDRWKTFLTVANDLPDHLHEEAIGGANFMFNEILKVAAAIC